MKRKTTTWKSSTKMFLSDYINIIGTFESQDISVNSIEYKESNATWTSSVMMYLSDYEYIIDSEFTSPSYDITTNLYSYEYINLHAHLFDKVYNRQTDTYRYIYQIKEEQYRLEKVEQEYREFIASLDYTINSKTLAKKEVRPLKDGYINCDISDMRDYINHLNSTTTWNDNNITIDILSPIEYEYMGYTYEFIGCDIDYIPFKVWDNKIIRWHENETKRPYINILENEYIVNSPCNINLDYVSSKDTYFYDYLSIHKTIDWTTINKVASRKRQHVILIPDNVRTRKQLLDWYYTNHFDTLVKGVIKYLATRKGKNLNFSYATIVCEEIMKNGYYQNIDSISDDRLDYYETYKTIHERMTDLVVNMFLNVKDYFTIRYTDKHHTYRNLEFKKYQVAKTDKETGQTNTITRSHWFTCVRCVENAIQSMQRFNSSSRIVALMKSEEKEQSGIDKLLDSYSSDCYQTIDERYQDNDIYNDFWNYVKVTYPKKHDVFKLVQRMRSNGYSNKEIALQFGKSERTIERMNTALMDIIKEYSMICHYNDYNDIGGMKRIRNDVK